MSFRVVSSRFSSKKAAICWNFAAMWFSIRYGPAWWFNPMNGLKSDDAFFIKTGRDGSPDPDSPKMKNIHQKPAPMTNIIQTFTLQKILENRSFFEKNAVSGR
jgi:hypothetical protein